MKNIYICNNNMPTKSLTLRLSLALVAVLSSSPVNAGKDSTDWDNDGLSDEVEALIGSGIYLADTDGDGISDKDEVGNITEPLDSDKDGLLNVVDIDDDGDGIPTAIEGTTDTDKDGKPAYLDTDSDDDGLADTFEVRLTGNDTDKDGVDDLFDVDSTNGEDSNGDGVDDNITLIDSNNNGIPDLLDRKTTIPHISARAKKSAAAKEGTTIIRRDDNNNNNNNNNNKNNNNNNTATKKVDTNTELKTIDKPIPIVVAAASLPSQVVTSIAYPKPKKTHRYIDNTPTADKEKAAYGGSGYFYCENTGKIVNNIPGFKMTPPEKTILLRDASEGDYQWSAENPGTYALQFQIPQGMSIVRGLAKGRRIVKAGDANPLILGTGKNPSKKGYLIKVPENNNDWYTSFEIKNNAPFVANNNIPLSGGVCDK